MDKTSSSKISSQWQRRFRSSGAEDHLKRNPVSLIFSAVLDDVRQKAHVTERIFADLMKGGEANIEEKLRFAPSY